MSNERIIERILNGEYDNNCKDVVTIVAYDLDSNASFERALRNEYVYEANKSDTDLLKLERLGRFWDTLQEMQKLTDLDVTDLF